MDGQKHLKVNTLERAVSNDLNRLQEFGEAGLSDMARWMFGVVEQYSDIYGGLVTEFPPGARSPYTNAMVVNGLLPYPVNGTLDLMVQPGVMFVEDSGTPDQSDFRYVRSDGVVSAGVLLLTPAPVATRIDVVECSLAADILEQDSRDIFDPSTGLFTPVLVDKVIAGKLAFRIRTGVAGAGFPGVVLGWVPLAVVSVPSGAATWNDCTLWDVRPLLSKSHAAPFVESISGVRTESMRTTIDYNAGSPTVIPVTGFIANKNGSIRQDGMAINHPTNALYVDVLNAENHAAGYTPLNGYIAYLWACMPFGLPIWRKYTGSPDAPRKPCGMSGVMAVSHVGPGANGLPSLSIALPTAGGLGGTTQIASIVAASVVGAAKMQQCVSDGTWSAPNGCPAIVPTSTGALSGTVMSRYDNLDGLYWPANSRAIRFSVVRTYTENESFDCLLHVIANARLVNIATGLTIATLPTKAMHTVIETTATNVQLYFEWEIPLHQLSSPGSRRIEVDYVQTWATIPTTPTPSVVELAQIAGWKLSP